MRVSRSLANLIQVGQHNAKRLIRVVSIGADSLRANEVDKDMLMRQHPTYRALVELGKAIKTTFLSRYLHEESLRQEINAGLNVVENWNSANGFIFYGKSGEIATNRLDDQELSVLSLHLLQACLVYINTLMLQDISTCAGTSVVISRV